jgi:hypothetical protein
VQVSCQSLLPLAAPQALTAAAHSPSWHMPPLQHLPLHMLPSAHSQAASDALQTAVNTPQHTSMSNIHEVSCRFGMASESYSSDPLPIGCRWLDAGASRCSAVSSHQQKDSCLSGSSRMKAHVLPVLLLTVYRVCCALHTFARSYARYCWLAFDAPGKLGAERRCRPPCHCARMVGTSKLGLHGKHPRTASSCMQLTDKPLSR